MFGYILLAIIFLLCMTHVLFNYNAKARLMRKLPGPRDRFILGNALEFAVSPEELMRIGRVFTSNWANIHRIWTFPFGAVIIYNPGDVETVISGTKYNEKSSIYKFLKPWLRNGLLLSNGETWHQRRKLLTPAFHFNILRQFFVILQENSHRLVNNLNKTDGRPIDVVPVLSEFTLHSICETAMGTQLSEGTSGAIYKGAIYDLGQLLLYRFTRVYLFFDWLFNLTATARATKKHLSIVHNFTQKVIKDRRECVNQNGINLTQNVGNDDDDIYKKRKKTAMLDLLLLAEKDGLIDTAGIQEEVDTFMFEGHDTTASGLTFCLMALANNKCIQDKIYSELKEIFGDSRREATMEDLTKMRYLECCIKESLRLYPPVHFISRNLNEPSVLSGYKIPAGVFCHILVLDLHRNPSIYKDPLVFDPDRFTPENSKGRHPYAYIPFSAGPRNCIGQKFAMMEMKLAVADILRNFVLEPVTRPEDLKFTADLVLRNAGPVKVSFVKRETKSL